jgi:hypothetical protein
MAQFKYIMVKVGNAEYPVIFSGNMVHSLVAHAIKESFVEAAFGVMPHELRTVENAAKLMDGMKVVGAGSITIDVAVCSGSSETLGVAARGHDAERIRMHPYDAGFVDDECTCACGHHESRHDKRCTVPGCSCTSFQPWVDTD